MTPDKLANINLLPTYERQSRTGFIIFMGLILIVILAFLAVGVDYFFSKNNLDKLQSEHHTLKAEVDELNVRVIALQEAGATDSLQDSVSFAENYNYPTSTFIEDLVTMLPDHSYLTDYNYRSLDVSITNEFESLDDVATYTASLTDSPYMNDAKVNNINAHNYLGEGEKETDLHFKTIPRYKVDFTLQVNPRTLKEGVDQRE